MVKMMLDSPVIIKPKAAKAELARRELARRHLVDFGEYMLPYYRRVRHHELVAEKLKQVELFIRSEGKEGIGRLLIMEPPQHGKSEQASQQFPAWLLGKLPDSRIILTSYALDRAAKNSRACRDLIKSERYRNLFGDRATVDVPVEISTDSTAVEAWDLAAPHRGGVVAAGVGGGLTGFGAHYIAVDDPVKNREEAESESRRELIWEWWLSTVYTRLRRGGAVVGMLTHWNGDDWAGRLLKAMANNLSADQWEVICLMALWEAPVLENRQVGMLEVRETYEQLKFRMMKEGVYVNLIDPLERIEGEALCPELFTQTELLKKKGNYNAGFEWEALYQQRPYDRKGNKFQRQWFAIIDNKPKEIISRVRAWDKAATEGAGAYTAGVCMSLGTDGLIYIEHVARGQWSTFEREEEMLRTARLDQEHRPGHTIIWHPQDPGSAGIDSAKATNIKLAKAGFEAHFEPVTGDKVTAAGPFSSACEAGIVRLVRGGWNDPFIDECAAFPKGNRKDQVDAAAKAYNKLVGELVLEGQLLY